MSATPVCPILSIRTPDVNTLCLTTDCALYLPPAQRCSLVYIGFKAMLETQHMQQQAPPGPAAR